MVSDVPTIERTSERSERSERWSERSECSGAEHGGANERASGALRSKRVNERVALFNDAVFSIIYLSAGAAKKV